MSHANGTILMVMDLQNDFCHPDGLYGRSGKGFEHVPAAASLILPTILEVMRTCRALHIPIVATKLLVLTDPSGNAIGVEHFRSDLQKLFSTEGFRRDTWGQEIMNDVLTQVRPDYEINKWGHSAMYLTELEKVLRALEAKHLVFTGVATNGVIEGTGRDAVSRGWAITALTDCVAAPNPKLHEASLLNLGHIGTTQSAAEFLSRLSS
jgi:ureidoacrylate peracid hydrolase